VVSSYHYSVKRNINICSSVGETPLTIKSYTTLVKNIISAGRDLFGLNFYQEHLPTKDMQNTTFFTDAFQKIPELTWKGMDLNQIR